MDVKLFMLFMLIGSVVALSKLETKSQRGIEKQKWLTYRTRI